MKKHLFSVALAALMALGSFTFASCEKDNDVVNTQTEQVSTKSLQFQINECFLDSMGRYWNMHGTGSFFNVNGGRNGVYLNVNFRQRGDDAIYYYKGQAIWNFAVRPAQFTLISDGDEPSRLVWFVMGEFSKHLLYD